MKPTLHFLAALPFAALLTAVGGARAADAPRVPANLAVPPGQVVATDVYARGVQIYDCKPAKDDPARFEWVFRSPQADLFDDDGQLVGRHYAGPTWEWPDGTRVVGAAAAQAPAPSADAIPWLLLSVKSTAGSGALARTVSVQRLETAGGKAPAGNCQPAVSEVRVPYTATYYFYVPKS